MVIRRIIGSHLCKAVGGQQFRKQSRKLQTRIMFEILLFLFPLLPVLLSLRDAPKQQPELTELGGHKQWLGKYGAFGPTVARTLATSTKNYTQVADFVNPRKKRQSHTLNQSCKFEPKTEKSRLFC